MKVFVVLAALVACAFADSRFKMCGGSVVRVDTNSIQGIPNPVKISVGTVLNIKATAEISRDLPLTLTARVKIERDMGWLGWWSVPCSLLGPNGCNLPVTCANLQRDFQWPPSCPIKAGTYKFDRGIKIPKIDLGGLGSMIGSGTYRGKVELLQGGQVIGCGEGKAKVELNL